VEHKLVLPVPDQARRLPANPPREDPIVVFCGNAQRLSEGFAIPLRAIGVEGHVGLFFLHFWAVDDAMKLAKGLRAALDRTASVKS
jgi:hypothetical protein